MAPVSSFSRSPSERSIPVEQLGDSLPWIVAAIAGVLIARAVVVYGMLGLASQLRRVLDGARPVPLAWLHVMFWAGLRGAVASAMALSLPTDFPQRELLIVIVFGVVLFTIIVQGGTAGWVVRWSGVGPGERHPPRPSKPVPSEYERLEPAEPALRPLD